MAVLGPLIVYGLRPVSCSVGYMHCLESDSRCTYLDLPARASKGSACMVNGGRGDGLGEDVGLGILMSTMPPKGFQSVGVRNKILHRKDMASEYQVPRNGVLESILSAETDVAWRQ